MPQCLNMISLRAMISNLFIDNESIEEESVIELLLGYFFRHGDNRYKVFEMLSWCICGTKGNKMET